MARGSRVDFSMAGARAHAQRLSKVPKRVEQVVARAKSTLVRRLGPETSRLVSSDVLNLSASRVRPHIHVKAEKSAGFEYVTVAATRTRLPLTDFGPRFTKHNGVTVTTWREKGAQHLPHAFKRRDGKAGVWQRIPVRKGSDAMVARLPIVQRKGPSLHRALEFTGRRARGAPIQDQLSRFVQATLSQEIARLLRVAPRP